MHQLRAIGRFLVRSGAPRSLVSYQRIAAETRLGGFSDPVAYFDQITKSDEQLC